MAMTTWVEVSRSNCASCWFLAGLPSSLRNDVSVIVEVAIRLWRDHFGGKGVTPGEAR